MKVTTKKWWWPVCLMGLWLPTWLCAQGVQATLSRHQMQLGETVELILSTSGHAGIDGLSTKALQKDFQVIGRSSGSQISIINGKRTERSTLNITLMPRRSGRLTVPALGFAGGYTTPLPLTVTPPDPAAAGRSGKRVFLEASIKPRRGYIGQQRVYTVRLYIGLDHLFNAQLEPPHLQTVKVRKLGDDLHYLAQRGGHRYRVIEQRYALMPTQSGNFKIPALRFQGTVGNTASPFADANRFFAQNGFGFAPGMLVGGKQIVALAPAQPLYVKAVPANWRGRWLPARQLSLALTGLPVSDTLHVGQVFNLHMRVQAQGLSSNTLPQPSLPTLSGASVYPDRSVDKTSDNGQWLHGQRDRSFAVIPQRPGRLTMPPVTLKWFDVQSGKTRIARIPAHHFTVLAALETSHVTPPKASTTAPSAASTPVLAGKATKLPKSDTLVIDKASMWRWIVWFGLGLVLLLVLVLSLLWWWQARKKVVAVQDRVVAVQDRVPGRFATRSLHQAFMRSLSDGNTSAQIHALLAWARAERPHLRNLGELSAALNCPAQRAAIQAMQQRQYSHLSVVAEPDLAKAFVKGFIWRSDSSHNGESALPPLYPFDLNQS